MKSGKRGFSLFFALLLICGNAYASDSFTSAIFSKNTHITAEQWFSDEESRAMFTTLAAIELVKNIDELKSTDALSEYLANPSWVGLSKSKKQIMSIGYLGSVKILVALLTPETGIIEYLQMEISTSGNSDNTESIVQSIIPQVFESQGATSEYYQNNMESILTAVKKIYGGE